MAENFLTVKNFNLHPFPEFYGLDFYLVGESYGGIYIPTLAQRVQEGQSTFPLELKGFSTGNGMLNYRQSDTSLMFYAYHHGLFDDNLWMDHRKEGGSETKESFFFHIHVNNASFCAKQVHEGQDIVLEGGLNPYSLYADCVHREAPERKQSEAPSRLEQDMKYLYPKHTSSVRVIVPCFDDHVSEDWFSRADVREALHVKENIPDQWLFCSDIPYTTLYLNMTSQFNYLHKEGVKGLVYNGDWDMMCNFLGNEWFLEDLG
ncbi:unnamed protein product, partial [Meganyctiphanes norvegica]